MHISNQSILHLPLSDGRFYILEHNNDDKNEEQRRNHLELLGDVGRVWMKDGLNSLNYTVISETKEELFTEILVKL